MWAKFVWNRWKAAKVPSRLGFTLWGCSRVTARQWPSARSKNCFMRFMRSMAFGWTGFRYLASPRLEGQRSDFWQEVSLGSFVDLSQSRSRDVWNSCLGWRKARIDRSHCRRATMRPLKLLSCSMCFIKICQHFAQQDRNCLALPPELKSEAVCFASGWQSARAYRLPWEQDHPWQLWISVGQCQRVVCQMPLNIYYVLFAELSFLLERDQEGSNWQGLHCFTMFFLAGNFVSCFFLTMTGRCVT